jgi:hypothetical protein
VTFIVKAISARTGLGPLILDKATQGPLGLWGAD